jgi:transcriptional regulator with XRE-family HTH domain
MRFRDVLHSVLLQRRSINRSYSLRSFARALGTDHASLSQLMRGERRITARTIRKLGPRLGLEPPQIDACRALENEACILDALTDPRFRPDSRWLAVTLNIPLDDINIALHQLLHKRLIAMTEQRTWSST